MFLILGIPYAKFEKIAFIIGLKFFEGKTFYRLRREYVSPVVRETWKDERKKVCFNFNEIFFEGGRQYVFCFFIIVYDYGIFLCR